MTSNGRREQGRGDASKRDVEFGILDPRLRSPGYWARLRGNVMERAANELYRRRLLRSVGVADLLQSWARMLVPAAVVAAAIGGVLLLRNPSNLAIDVEEALRLGLEDQTLADVMEQGDIDDPFLLIEETF
jgi:hypothetical protein